MGEQKNTEQAKAIFSTICKLLDRNDWTYVKNEEKLIIECKYQGEDIPVDISLMVDEERSLVVLLSRMPLFVKEDKRVDMAIAVSAINNILVDGNFDYDITTGNTFFRMSHSFIDSVIGEEAFAYMLVGACRIVDDYNDKLLMLTKGMISTQQFLSELKTD